MFIIFYARYLDGVHVNRKRTTSNQRRKAVRVNQDR